MMPERPGEGPAHVDMGALSKAVLDAAHAARIGIAVTFVDLPKPLCVYINDAAAEIVGWPAEELMKGDPLRNVVPEEKPKLLERFARRSSGENRAQQSYEVVVLRKDGRRATIEVTTSAATMEGRPVVFAFIVDVTARKEAEKARILTESNFRHLMEIAPEPFGILRDGKFVFANAAYAGVLGFSRVEDLYGYSVADFVNPDEVESLKARGKFIREGGRPSPTIYHARRRDGSTILLEASSGPCEYEGHPAVVTMGRDVSARNALDAQLVQADRLAAIGTMAAGVAHEINNPLAYLMLNLDWIARKLPDSASDPSSVEALIEVLREAHRGAERVASIVRELRTFSRADAETRCRVDLAAVARSSIKMAGHELRHRARVSTSFEPAGFVWANESRLEQVVLNLLLNAAHAMPETRTTSNEIRVQVRKDGDATIVLEVSDNGEGIAQEILPRIFDPFFTTKPRGVGMGLGLSICHGIVTSLGGQITVHSTPSEGTTFRVALPSTNREDADADPPPSGAIAARLGPRAQVLVIDDEIPIANTMRDLLSLRHDVTATNTASDALVAIESGQNFDVIFCDLMMPGMSGIDLYEHLRQNRPALARRIVFMTGGAFTKRAAEFLAATENRRVEKPFSLELIERIVHEIARPGTGVE
jgi:PAS domain S-box-containing protein